MKQAEQRCTIGTNNGLAGLDTFHRKEKKLVNFCLDNVQKFNTQEAVRLSSLAEDISSQVR